MHERVISIPDTECNHGKGRAIRNGKGSRRTTTGDRYGLTPARKQKGCRAKSVTDVDWDALESRSAGCKDQPDNGPCAHARKSSKEGTKHTEHNKTERIVNRCGIRTGPWVRMNRYRDG